MFNFEIMRLNTLNGAETLVITASVWSIFDEKWNCYKCMTDDNFKALKKVKGCVSTPKTNYTVEGFKINKCLGNFASKEIYGVFEMFSFFKKGIMPFPGSFSEQPAKIVDVFNMIDQLKTQKLEEQKKRKSKQNN